jgi:hypothetical protein
MRTALAAISLAVCLLGMWTSWRIGHSRLLADRGAKNKLLASTERAVRFSPLDPEAHYAHAVVLLAQGQRSDAIKEFEEAVALRPRDYVLWLDLAGARDRQGDVEGALIAFKEAARLAPHYAEPRWKLGYHLLLMRQSAAAFAEFRQAIISDPSLLPAVIDFAWQFYGGDPQAVQQSLLPQNNTAQLELARFFVRQGKTAEAMDLFRHARGITDRERRAFLTELLAAEQFREGYEVWSGKQSDSIARHRDSVAAITDGGFEGKISFDEVGFGWQIWHDPPSVRVSLDANEPQSEEKSLRLDWNGMSDPANAVASQLVLVEPNANYRLTFSARTQDIVSGGLPIVSVGDASHDKQTLAQSIPLPQSTGEWQDYEMKFATTSATRAVLIAIRRQYCSDGPCPIFGRAWFDSFSLQKL